MIISRIIMPASLYLFNDSITERYKTLEKNIKSKSKSFYDSYLDLFEETLRYFLKKDNVPYSDRDTCGQLLRNEIIKTYLFDVLKLERVKYFILIDRVGKINEHKHDSEKEITLEAIIPVLNEYFDFVNLYNDHTNAKIMVFDVEYVEKIFGESEKIGEKISTIDAKVDSFGLSLDELVRGMSDLTNEVKSLKEENKHLYSEIKNHQTQKNIGNNSSSVSATSSNISPRNTVSNVNVVQQFFTKAKKDYVWLGPYSILKKESDVVTAAYVVAIFVGIISTILTSVALSMYSTFTLVENIWLITTIVMFVRHLKRGDRVDHKQFAKSFRTKFVAGEYGLFTRSSKTKFWHKFIQVLLVIACICNCIVYWIPDTDWEFNSNGIKAVALIFELLMIASSIFVCLAPINLEIGYETVVAYTNCKPGTKQKITIYGNIIRKEYIDEAEFKRRFDRYKTM